MSQLAEREAEAEASRRQHQGLVKELGVVASRYARLQQQVAARKQHQQRDSPRGSSASSSRATTRESPHQVEISLTSFQYPTPDEQSAARMGVNPRAVVASPSAPLARLQRFNSHGNQHSEPEAAAGIPNNNNRLPDGYLAAITTRTSTDIDAGRSSVGGTPGYVCDILSVLSDVEAQRDDLQAEVQALTERVEAVRAETARLAGRFTPAALAALSLAEAQAAEQELELALRAAREAVTNRRIADARAAAAAAEQASSPSLATASPCCSICLERPRGMVFNCGHQACAKCSEPMSSCPFCRVTITARIKLFDA